AFAVGLATTVPPAHITAGARVTFREVRANPRVWAGWIVAASGLLTQGVVFTFFPLLGEASGLSPAAIGLVFQVLGIAHPAARGLVMGGYSTALYLGLALGSFALGPVIMRYGYATGFSIGGVVGAVGAVFAAVLWVKARNDRCEPSAV